MSDRGVEAEFRREIDAIMRIDRRCFAHTFWSAESFLKPLPMKWRLSRLARATGIVAGYCVASAAISGVAHLNRMAVDPGHRNAGMGGAMLGAMERAAARLGLHAITLELDGAEGDYAPYYARHGFVLASDELCAAYERTKAKVLPVNRRVMFKVVGAEDIAAYFPA